MVVGEGVVNVELCGLVTLEVTGDVGGRGSNSNNKGKMSMLRSVFRKSKKTSTPPYVTVRSPQVTVDLYCSTLEETGELYR